MKRPDAIGDLANDPEQLELAYRDAVAMGDEAAFEAAIHAGHEEAADNVLLAAWHFRLVHGAVRAARRAIAWSWAVPLAISSGLLLWLISDEQRYQIKVTNPVSGSEHWVLPAVVLLAAPITAAAVAAFLAIVGRRGSRRALVALLGLAVLCAYVLLAYGRAGPRAFQEQYLQLMVMHLALAAWAAVGIVALAYGMDAANRFAFLAKSLELVIVAGIFTAAGGVFVAVTFALYTALGVDLPDAVQRLIVAGGAGLVVVLSAALVYEPRAAPVEQPFDEGPSRLVATLLRILLPLSVLVLTVYVGLIPVHAGAPFESREVLVAYNAMLFAVMGLLVGATPIRSGEVGRGAERWLRLGVVALAALALVVGAYALVAIVYRTAGDRLTPNRLAFIGWNVVNLFVLAWLLVSQWRCRASGWLAALQRTMAVAVLPYALWTLVVILATPWVFRVDASDVAGLPEAIQAIAFDRPAPVLLKCDGSPHIYLLEDGRKRWIEDIPTFGAQGFQWRDVNKAPCEDIDAIPDGPPIPPDAGSPPPPTDRPASRDG